MGLDLSGRRTGKAEWARLTEVFRFQLTYVHQVPLKASIQPSIKGGSKTNLVAVILRGDIGWQRLPPGWPAVRKIQCGNGYKLTAATMSQRANYHVTSLVMIGGRLDGWEYPRRSAIKMRLKIIPRLLDVRQSFFCLFVLNPLSLCRAFSHFLLAQDNSQQQRPTTTSQPQSTS